MSFRKPLILCLTLTLLALGGLPVDRAEANQGFVGEIRLFAGTFIPAYWAECDGTVLNVNYYPALFAVLGNTFGGDGVTTFALPDLRGRVPVHPGQGAGLTPRTAGVRFGSETTLIHSGSSDGQQLSIVEKKPDDSGNSLTSVGPAEVLHYIICIEGVSPTLP